MHSSPDLGASEITQVSSSKISQASGGFIHWEVRSLGSAFDSQKTRNNFSVVRVCIGFRRAGSQAAERVAVAESYFNGSLKFNWELGHKAHSRVRSDKGLKVSFAVFLDKLQLHVASVRLTSLKLNRCWEICGPRACNSLGKSCGCLIKQQQWPCLPGCRDCKASWSSLLINASSKTKQRKSL